MKIVFLGTPDFAVPSLQALVGSMHEIAAVVCQPDKPSDRGKKISFGPIKKIALENNIKVLQYKKIRLEGVEDLKAINPDIMVTAAYGQIISKEIIDIPKYGIINVHGSLLPKYRGGAPIQWAIVNGETKTGITIMQTDVGLDTGDMLLKTETEIGNNETAGELFERLANMGAKLLLEALDKIESGKVTREKQNDLESSYFPMIKKEMARIDFNKKALEVVNLVRGFNPWPVAYFEYDNNSYKIYKAKALNGNYEGQSGEIISCNKKELIIKCAEGAILVEKIQAPNGKVLEIREFLNGNSFSVGAIV